MRRWIVAAGMLGLLGFLIIRLIAPTPEGTDKHEKVVMATDGAYPPYIATGTNGELIGFEADLAKDLCRRAGKRCEWVRQSFDGMIPALDSGRFDAIMSSLSITPERTSVVEFTNPYFNGPTVVMATASFPYAPGPADGKVIWLPLADVSARAAMNHLSTQMKGRSIGVQTGSNYEVFARKYFGKSATVKGYTEADQMFMDLAIGRIDALVVGDGEVSAKLLEEQRAKGHPIENIGPLFRGDELSRGIAIAFKKGETKLRDEFNVAIAAAIKDGTVTRLGMKWFGSDGAPVAVVTAPADAAH